MRIVPPELENTPAESRPTIDNVNKRLGFIPNMHRVMSLSPASLNGWSALLNSLSKTLDVKTRDGIGLAVSEVNGCNYCLSVHTYTATNFAMIPAEEIALNRQGRSSDPKRQAALHFARRLTQERGKVTDADFSVVRDAGYSDAQIVDIITLVGQYSLTNFINNSVDPEKDFPSVEPAFRHMA